MWQFLVALIFPTVAAFAPTATNGRSSVVVNLNIVRFDTDIISIASGLQGPGIPWGSDGVAKGHLENEIRGYEGFGLFLKAVDEAGLTDLLRDTSGPFTVFMPVDSAMENFKGEMTPDLLKYHVVNGAKEAKSIDGDLETLLPGQSLSYRRMARKTFLDDAIIGQGPSGAATGEVYPIDVLLIAVSFYMNEATDYFWMIHARCHCTITASLRFAQVECSNGIIHTIDSILVPGYISPDAWTPTAGTGIANAEL